MPILDDLWDSVQDGAKAIGTKVMSKGAGDKDAWASKHVAAAKHATAAKMFDQPGASAAKVPGPPPLPGSKMLPAQAKAKSYSLATKGIGLGTAYGLLSGKSCKDPVASIQVQNAWSKWAK